MWKIAKQHGVDFNQLKELNSQLSSPDMIMPGMKIKVPTNAKPVKKESMVTEKEMVKTPYKDISPKPLPVIKEDEKPLPQKPKPQMPKMQQPPKQPMMPPISPIYNMPINDQDTYQFTNINFSQMAPPKKEMKYPEKMHPMHHGMPIPMCCYPMYPMHHMPPMHHPNVAPMHMQPLKPMPYKKSGCGCHGNNQGYPSQVMNMYDEMPDMKMPKKPEQMKHHYQYGGMNQSFPDMNNEYESMNPKPPGFRPFPTASFRDDEEESSEE